MFILTVDVICPPLKFPTVTIVSLNVLLVLQLLQTLQPITDISSSSCESDADRSAVENDSEEVGCYIAMCICPDISFICNAVF